MRTVTVLLVSWILFAVEPHWLRADEPPRVPSGVPSGVPAEVQNLAIAQEAPIDFDRARQLLQKRSRGESLTPDEQAYLARAVEQRRLAQQPGRSGTRDERALTAVETSGLKPIDEMTADDHYLDQDGGLYGRGANEPPEPQRQAALQALREIRPLDRSGIPSPDGQVVLVSISMSNATQEFSRFKQIADVDPDKSPRLTIVDCAQGGQAMAEWVDPEALPWREAMRRLDRSGVSPRQVQVAWIKIANKAPRGELQTHGQKLKNDTAAVIEHARSKFPNLRIVYLSSRIYGGHSSGSLNPEPYAYESGFVVRWLIQDQIAARADAEQTPPAPVLLWGPYLWADGITPRSSDRLAWQRTDLAADGTHPSESGRDKVARMLLTFCKENSLARGWFVAPPDDSP